MPVYLYIWKERGCGGGGGGSFLLGLLPRAAPSAAEMHVVVGGAHFSFPHPPCHAPPRASSSLALPADFSVSPRECRFAPVLGETRVRSTAGLPRTCLCAGRKCVKTCVSPPGFFFYSFYYCRSCDRRPSSCALATRWAVANGASEGCWLLTCALRECWLVKCYVTWLTVHRGKWNGVNGGRKSGHCRPSHTMRCDQGGGM